VKPMTCQQKCTGWNIKRLIEFYRLIVYSHCQSVFSHMG
jgi:hypothetical protein